MTLSGKEVAEGLVIADRYQLEQPLGRGAMGRIWTAEHLSLKSRVAIKFLDPEIAEDPEMFARFLQEAQSAAAVRSAHVVQIFDYGVEGGTPFIAMELLTGESLDARLGARGTLTPGELHKIISEVARAISNAHEIGVIHRDLKPGNIFIAREGEFEITKVLDFGIAKVMNRAQGSAAGTQTGTVLGTPQYMSPEQVRGSPSLDHRTDLWSLAVIAFECLTGELPFQGGGIGDFLVQICTCEPLVPSTLADVPPGFDEWFVKGVRKEPSERFASAREMAESLGVILARAPFSASPEREPRAGPTLIQGGSRPRADSTGPRRLSTEVVPAPAVPIGSVPIHPLKTLLLRATAILKPVRALPTRSRWLSFGAPLSLLCAAGILAMWPQNDTAPPSVAAREFASALSPEGAALAAANAPPPARADAGVPRISIAAAGAVPNEAAASGAPSAAAPAASSSAPVSSKPRVRMTAAPRRAASIAEEPRQPKRSVDPALAPRTPTPRPAATPRERRQHEAFSERL